jgi:predicted esterase
MLLKKTNVLFASLLFLTLISCGVSDSPDQTNGLNAPGLTADVNPNEVFNDSNRPNFFRDANGNYVCEPWNYEKAENAGRKYPLLVYLHGTGQDNFFRNLYYMGYENTGGYKVEVAKNFKKTYPCLVFIPQTTATSWDISKLITQIEELKSKYRVDTDRIYLHGYSMGGSATFDLANAYAPQQLFAGIIRLTGRVATPTVIDQVVRRSSIWLMVGVKDWFTWVDATRYGYSYLKNHSLNTGGVETEKLNYTIGVSPNQHLVNTVTYTKDGVEIVKKSEFPDGNSNIACYPFDDPDVFTWLFAQNLRLTSKVTYNGNGNTGGVVPTDAGNYAKGQTVTVLGNTGSLIRGDLTFRCWNTASDGSGTSYNSGDTFVIGADVTLYAVWAWTRQMGAVGLSTEGQGISVDASGNSYVTGYTHGSLDGQEITGYYDAFVIKYDSSATKQWTRQLGASGAITCGLDISVDSSGNSYVTGYTRGSLDGQGLTGLSDVFVVKYNSSGTKQWTRQLGASGKYTYGQDISVDSSGNSYVTGQTNGSLDGQETTGLYDVFVVKYNSSGTKQWTRQLGASANTWGKGISIDSSGNSYVTGYTHGSLDGQGLTGYEDVFVVKYDSSGTKQWTRQLGASGASTCGMDISVDSSGNSYVTGYTQGSLDEQEITGLYDVFVVKYDSSGTKQWTRQLGASGTDTYGQGISVDSSGNSYVTGDTRGSLDGQETTGSYDVFVIKYDSSGTKQWTKLLGVSGKQTIGTGISVDSTGKTYVTGYTSGSLDGQTITGTRDVFVTTQLNP